MTLIQKLCYYRFLTLSLLLLLTWGCRTPDYYRSQANKNVQQIIESTQLEVLGKTTEFSIERPSDMLRRQLIINQHLPHTGPATLGTDVLPPVPGWPMEEKGGNGDIKSANSEPSQNLTTAIPNPLPINLISALQIGARNSFDYQTKKEEIFRAALNLDLERHQFRQTYSGRLLSQASTDGSNSLSESGLETNAVVGVARKFQSGLALSGQLFIDLVQLLTMGEASSLGILGDATMTVPILRGSGKQIVAEPLTQSEREVMYALQSLERFKEEFAVEIASRYYRVQNQYDQSLNARANYRSLQDSTKRARQLAEAGRRTIVEVDQTAQDELRARDNWINSSTEYQNQLDNLKKFIGLPPDARLEIKQNELEALRIANRERINLSRNTGIIKTENPKNISAPETDSSGKDQTQLPMKIFSLSDDQAIEMALIHRRDLQVAQQKIVDAQRQVAVAADGLRAELTLMGKAEMGERRDLNSVHSSDSRLQPKDGRYAALLSLDLPFDRRAEQNRFRDGYIVLEQAVRSAQALEDDIKLAVRARVRNLKALQDSLEIQTQSVQLAERRIKSVNMFLDAGRAQIRDLLEAQAALLSAQNSLTSALVNYRVAELELQRDMGLLVVDETGLFVEYVQ